MSDGSDPQAQPSAADLAWLTEALSAAGATAGSVHRWDGALLRLTAAVRLPPPVQRAVATVPAGKGMAGLAYSRRAPVLTCDLKTDDTGDVRPGARAVDAHAAVALPVLDGGGAVRAVVGFAFSHGDALSEATLARLSGQAARLP